MVGDEQDRVPGDGVDGLRDAPGFQKLEQPLLGQDDRKERPLELRVALGLVCELLPHAVEEKRELGLADEGIDGTAQEPAILPADDPEAQNPPLDDRFRRGVVDHVDGWLVGMEEVPDPEALAPPHVHHLVPAQRTGGDGLDPRPLLGVQERAAGAEEQLPDRNVPAFDRQLAVGDQPVVGVDHHHVEIVLGELTEPFEHRVARHVEVLVDRLGDLVRVVLIEPLQGAIDRGVSRGRALRLSAGRLLLRQAALLVLLPAAAGAGIVAAGSLRRGQRTRQSFLSAWTWPPWWTSWKAMPRTRSSTRVVVVPG